MRDKCGQSKYGLVCECLNGRENMIIKSLPLFTLRTVLFIKRLAPRLYKHSSPAILAAHWTDMLGDGRSITWRDASSAFGHCIRRRRMLASGPSPVSGTGLRVGARWLVARHFCLSLLLLVSFHEPPIACLLHGHWHCPTISADPPGVSRSEVYTASLYGD